MPNGPQQRLQRPRTSQLTVGVDIARSRPHMAGSHIQVGIYPVDCYGSHVRRNTRGEGSMHRSIVAGLMAIGLTTAVVGAQQTERSLSPDGSAQAQVLGRWTKGERPAFTLGRENYVGGKWIEITYGRPLQRGRELFGSGPNYGKAVNDVGSARLPAPPVWRAGANVSTRLKTESALTFGDKTVPAGEYSLFIDLNGPTQWTLIVSSWAAQSKFDPNNKTALWGAYNYTPDKDVARISMKVENLPFAVEQLTWAFLDMTNDGGRVALMWGKTLASASFKAKAS
jgi:hypothetical protein